MAPAGNNVRGEPILGESDASCLAIHLYADKPRSLSNGPPYGGHP